MLNVTELRKQFSSKDEEIAFLRSLILEQDDKLKQKGETVSSTKSSNENKENQINDLLKKYKQEDPKNILDKNFALSENHIDTISLGLSPEEHDNKLQKLIDIFLTDGIKNVFSILAKMNDSHLEDDFHRFLVQYILKYDVSKKFGP